MGRLLGILLVKGGSEVMLGKLAHMLMVEIVVNKLYILLN